MRKASQYQFFEPYDSPRAEVFGGPNLFPEDITQQLIEVADVSTARKQMFEFDHPPRYSPSVPSAIIRAAQWSNDMQCPVNTAVLKKYSLDDVQQSEAYQLHKDPEIYGSQRIALISLSGVAELKVVTSTSTPRTFTCLPRTVVFLAPNLLHAVTKPLNSDGVRHFLFLGYKI